MAAYSIPNNLPRFPLYSMGSGITRESRASVRTRVRDRIRKQERSTAPYTKGDLVRVMQGKNKGWIGTYHHSRVIFCTTHPVQVSHENQKSLLLGWFDRQIRDGFVVVKAYPPKSGPTIIVDGTHIARYCKASKTSQNQSSSKQPKKKKRILISMSDLESTFRTSVDQSFRQHSPAAEASPALSPTMQRVKSNLESTFPELRTVNNLAILTTEQISQVFQEYS